MRIKDLLNTAAGRLAGVENGENEARWILESVLGCSSSYIFMNPDKETDLNVSDEFFSRIEARCSGLPVQYIIGEWDFYGRPFKVGEGVLIPRPETEQLVDVALAYIRANEIKSVLDLCSGTGCIGMTIAMECPETEVVLVEKYPDALKYLRMNAEQYSLNNIRILNCDVLSDYDSICGKDYELIVSNPPYINTCDISSLQAEVKKEPDTALDGGEDGLDFYRCFAEHYSDKCLCAFLFECGENQASDISGIFRNFGKAESFTDFNGTERIVMVERKP